MNKTFKKDFESIIKKYKKTNNPDIKNLCLHDYYYLTDLLMAYFPWEKGGVEELDLKPFMEIFDKENKSINDDIVNNIDKLIELYEIVLGIFDKIDIEYDKTFEEDKKIEVDYNVLYNFLNQYPGFTELYNHIYQSNHVIKNEISYQSCTYILPSIDEFYLVISTLRPNVILKSFAHELGHTYQEKLIYDNKASDIRILEEFLSMLMEFNFVDYYYSINSKDARKMTINSLALYREVFKIGYAQLQLLKTHKDAFVNMYLDNKYKDELNKLCNTKLNFNRDQLYLQSYFICFMLSLRFFYQLKYGLDFNEIEKFFIENNKEHNIQTLLDYIDIQSIEDFIGENTKGKRR